MKHCRRSAPRRCCRSASSEVRRGGQWAPPLAGSNSSTSGACGCSAYRPVNQSKHESKITSVTHETQAVRFTEPATRYTAPVSFSGRQSTFRAGWYCGLTTVRYILRRGSGVLCCTENPAADSAAFSHAFTSRIRAESASDGFWEHGLGFLCATSKQKVKQQLEIWTIL